MRRLAEATLFDLGSLTSTIFGFMDDNDDGYLSKSEIEKGQSRSLKYGDPDLQQAALNESLKVNYDFIRNLSNDEWGDDSTGISMRDLKKLNWQEGYRVLPPTMYLNAATPVELRKYITPPGK